MATEISDLCSVLKQLQILLEHAHFQPSATAIEAAQRIIAQCSKVFTEIDDIVGDLRKAKGDDLFPSVDFVGKVKWTFSKKSKVLMLRTTLEACKSTLNVMLTTLLLAERVSQRRKSGDTNLTEEEQDKIVTQSLVIAQQCAVEQLEHYEDEVEKEEQAAMQFPGFNHASTRPPVHTRRKSRGRLVRMFSGLSVITDLPSPPAASQQQPPTRAERASIWLDSILAPPDAHMKDPHPGMRREKRLSSVGTENAPLQLLRKWTDQAEHLTSNSELAPLAAAAHEPSELWRESKFSFSGSKFSSVTEEPEQLFEEATPTMGIARAPTTLVSPKTARVQSIGYHVVVGVDGLLESSSNIFTSSEADDSYDAITRAIMLEHGAAANADEVTLCVSYGGKTKVLNPFDKPLEVLRHYEELELDPRLFLRRVQPRPP